MISLTLLAQTKQLFKKNPVRMMEYGYYGEATEQLFIIQIHANAFL